MKPEQARAGPRHPSRVAERLPQSLSLLLRRGGAGLLEQLAPMFLLLDVMALPTRGRHKGRKRRVGGLGAAQQRVYLPVGPCAGPASQAARARPGAPEWRAPTGGRQICQHPPAASTPRAGEDIQGERPAQPSRPIPPGSRLSTCRPCFRTAVLRAISGGAVHAGRVSSTSRRWPSSQAEAVSKAYAQIFATTICRTRFPALESFWSPR